MELKIIKIKYDGSEVEINYAQVKENSDDIKIVLKSNDKPLPEFKNCLSSLAPFVEKICKLPAGYCDEADVRSVSFSHSHDIMGAVITCLIPVDTANSPLCLNTPFLPSDQYNDGGTAPTLPTECINILNDLMEYAKRYINGERDIPPDNQTKLDLPD